jgi:hypothetical protein
MLMEGYEQVSTARDALLKDLQIIEITTRFTATGGDLTIMGRASDVLGKTIALARLDADRYLDALEQFRVKNGLR